MNKYLLYLVEQKIIIIIEWKNLKLANLMNLIKKNIKIINENINDNKKRGKTRKAKTN